MYEYAIVIPVKTPVLAGQTARVNLAVQQARVRIEVGAELRKKAGKKPIHLSGESPQQWLVLRSMAGVVAHVGVGRYTVRLGSATGSVVGTCEVKTGTDRIRLTLD